GDRCAWIVHGHRGRGSLGECGTHRRGRGKPTAAPRRELMAGLVYDTGMLIALDRGVPQAWRLHERVNVASRVPVLPMVVLAQAWRGGPQPRLSRALRGCRHMGVTEPLARYVAKRGPQTSSTQWWLFSQRNSTLLLSHPTLTTWRTSV